MAFSKGPSRVFDEISLDRITRQPFPNSRKIYVAGSRLSIRVPMREITQTATRLKTGQAQGTELPNPPITVYDTSGPYTDADAGIDLRKGLPPIRLEWILA